MNMFGKILCVGLFMLPLVGVAHADAALTGQTATYDLRLAKVRGHSVTGATGLMQFDALETCHAWGVTQRMTLLIRNEDGSLTRSVSDYVTWEAKDGHSLSFNLQQSEDGKTETNDAGTATRGAGGIITVVYTTPKGRVLTLPKGTLFPMAHTAALIDAGEAGKKFIAPPLFDGTSKHGAEHTFVAITKLLKPAASSFPSLSALPSADVDIAFYKRDPTGEDPDFRTQMRYYSNGVADNIMLDFGDFVMSGKLTKLVIPPSACAAK